MMPMMADDGWLFSALFFALLSIFGCRLNPKHEKGQFRLTRWRRLHTSTSYAILKKSMYLMSDNKMQTQHATAV